MRGTALLIDGVMTTKGDDMEIKFSKEEVEQILIEHVLYFADDRWVGKKITASSLYGDVTVYLEDTEDKGE